MEKEGEGGMFGGSEFITGGGCGCADGGDVKYGGGLFEDLYPVKGIANFNPLNWTLHGVASSLMLLGILLLVIWMFMPDASDGLAILAGVFALFYVLFDIINTTPVGKAAVNLSINDYLSGRRMAANALASAVSAVAM